MRLRFCYNPTSWRDGPIVGDMADRLIAPVVEHLPDELFEVADRPTHNRANVYYTHRITYPCAPPAREVSIFVSHGIADKHWRTAERVRYAFDYVCSSGPAWSRRYRDLDAVKVIECGYAKLDGLYPLCAGQQSDRPDRVRVLWAPTHGGGGEAHRFDATSPGTKGSRCSTHWSRDELVALLPPSEFELVEAVHPRHRADGRATWDEYRACDVVIADGGSTMYEAWALDLPVVFPDWIVGEANLKRHGNAATFEHLVYRDRIGRHVDGPAGLAAAVIDAAERGITGPELDFIEPILPRAYRGISGRLHAEAFADIARGGNVRHTRERW